MPTKRASPRPHFLAALIRTGYLPRDVPPIVSTRKFSDYCRSRFKLLDRMCNKLDKIATTYDTFSAPRSPSGRRTFAIVNPVSQLALSLHITYHRSIIKSKINFPDFTLYNNNEDLRKEKAFVGLEFSKRRQLETIICSQSDFVLRADISRFFYTIYTHSIPWAIIGKEKVKTMLTHNKSKLMRHWSNSLDNALQKCQSRETFGIPVGPDTSRIIAELLLHGVESHQPLRRLIKKQPRYRLLDDFFIGFREKSEADRTLTALRNALWSYNLQLNEEKTHVVPSSEIIEQEWKQNFVKVRINDIDAKHQMKDINFLSELALSSCLRYHSSIPSSWACSRISKMYIFDENLKHVVDILLRLIRHYPIATKHAVAFLINNQNRCRRSDIKVNIDRWVRETIKKNIYDSKDYETAWCLMMVVAFDIKLTKDDFGDFNEMPRSIVFAILGVLRKKGVLPVSLEKFGWRALYKKEGIYGQNWLPFYEAVLRGWTVDKEIINAVKMDSLFNELLKYDVSFLDERVLSAQRINLSRRMFSGRTPSGTEGGLGGHGGAKEKMGLIVETEEYE